MADEKMMADLADRFLERCLDTWVARGLPVEALARPMAALGLLLQASRIGVDGVSAHLHDVADAFEAAHCEHQAAGRC